MNKRRPLIVSWVGSFMLLKIKEYIFYVLKKIFNDEFELHLAIFGCFFYSCRGAERILSLYQKKENISWQSILYVGFLLLFISYIFVKYMQRFLRKYLAKKEKAFIEKCKSFFFYSVVYFCWLDIIIRPFEFTSYFFYFWFMSVVVKYFAKIEKARFEQDEKE